jgi:hypothetical protein
MKKKNRENSIFGVDDKLFLIYNKFQKKNKNFLLLGSINQMFIYNFKDFFLFSWLTLIPNFTVVIHKYSAKDNEDIFRYNHRMVAIRVRQKAFR